MTLGFANLGNNFALVFNEVRENSISFFCDPLQLLVLVGTCTLLPITYLWLHLQSQQVKHTAKSMF